MENKQAPEREQQPQIVDIAKLDWYQQKQLDDADKEMTSNAMEKAIESLKKQQPEPRRYTLEEIAVLLNLFVRENGWRKQAQAIQDFIRTQEATGNIDSLLKKDQ